MFVSDLRHFLEVDDDSPAPARRMAAQVGAIVKAATAIEAGQAWVSGIACTRRPGRRPCPGRIGLRRSEAPASIRWECVACGDAGVIHGWEDSYADLRSPTAPLGPEPIRVIVSFEVADLLRSVLFFDIDVERLVYGGRARVDGVEIEGDIDVFGDLLDAVAAEANHEQNTRRRKHIDALFPALADALSAPQPDTAPATPPDRSTQIRPATTRDLEAVLRLWQEADAEATHTDNLDSLNGLLDNDPSALLIAENAGVLVGSVIAAWNGWRGSIYRLVVAPSHRRQGLATTLLNAADQRLRSHGAMRRQAIVTETNPAALGFWTASGWERQAHRARFVKG
jgi:ribosomal protein S18 acetylase RimI-like enzyme